MSLPDLCCCLPQTREIFLCSTHISKTVQRQINIEDAKIETLICAIQDALAYGERNADSPSDVVWTQEALNVIYKELSRRA